MNKMQKLGKKRYIIKNLDIVACIFGIIFGISIASLYLISKTIHLFMLGLALTLASLLYLILKNYKKDTNITISSSKKIILEIVFFSLFSISLLVLQTNENRPFLYFVLISLLAGLLALSILNINSKIDTGLQILKILILSFNIKYSLFLFYGGNGVDYWTHLQMNKVLSIDGFIKVLRDTEQFFP